MTPTLTLTRPERAGADAVGDDGLTEAERAESARSFHQGIGRKQVSAAELAAFARFRAEQL